MVWDQPAEPRCTLRISVATQAWGFVGGLDEGDRVVYPNVARIKWVGVGNFGVFSPARLVANLVEAVVLGGIAVSVTTGVARFWLGASFQQATTNVYKVVSDGCEGKGVVGRKRLTRCEVGDSR